MLRVNNRSGYLPERTSTDLQSFHKESQVFRTPRGKFLPLRVSYVSCLGSSLVGVLEIGVGIEGASWEVVLSV